jgi:hypothetical protein
MPMGPLCSGLAELSPRTQLPCTSSPVAPARPASASVPAPERRHAAAVSLRLWPLAPARHSLEPAVARSAAVLRTPVPRARLVPLGAARLRAACLGPPARRLPWVRPVPSTRRLGHASARRRPPATHAPPARAPTVRTTRYAPTLRHLHLAEPHAPEPLSACAPLARARPAWARQPARPPAARA